MSIINVDSSVSEVCNYLSNLKLKDHTFEDCTENFQNEYIDGKVFLNLEKKELNALGIFKFSRRNVLYEHIKQLRNDPTNQNYDAAQESKLSSKSHSFKGPAMLTLTNSTSSGPQNNVLPSSPSTVSTPQINFSNFSPVSPSHLINTRLVQPIISPFPPTPHMFNFDVFAIKGDAQVAPPPCNRYSASAVYRHPSSMMSPASWMIAASMQSNSGSNSNSFPNPNFFPIQNNNNMQKQHQPIKQTQPRMNANINHRRIPTEKCYYRVKQSSKNLVKFIGVYRGINASKQIFTLMSQKHIEQFNKIAKRWSRTSTKWESFNSAISGQSIETESSSESKHHSYDSEDEDKESMEDSIFDTILENDEYNNDNIIQKKKHVLISNTMKVTMCDVNSAEQVFNSKLNIMKMNNGWDIEGVHVPFNPMVVFTFDFFRNEMISIHCMDVSGVINNIDNRGLMWIACTLKINAIEDHNKKIPGDKCGPISHIQFMNNRKGQFKDRNVSYLIHDWVNVEFDCEKGDGVVCCMKLSTKTNQKWSKRKRPVFIQTWNVRADPNKQMLNNEQRDKQSKSNEEFFTSQNTE